MLVARKALKRLYALLHVKPGERAQQILFDERPAAGQPARRAEASWPRRRRPAEQAQAIVEHRIPYRVAATVVPADDADGAGGADRAHEPAGADQQPGARCKRRGALDNPELKALIEQKLEEAKTAKRVSAFKAEEAVEGGRPSADVTRRSWRRWPTRRSRPRAGSRRPTALLIDKSGSMEQAIELGKRIGAMISAVCEKELYVYAFDTMAYPIEPAGDDLAVVGAGVRGHHRRRRDVVRRGAGDACARKQQYVEQIILVTDEGENTRRSSSTSLLKYRRELKARPERLHRADAGQLDAAGGRSASEAGIAVDAFQFSGDYYSLPNLVPLLAPPSQAGAADGDHGVPAAGAEAGLIERRRRAARREPAGRCNRRAYAAPLAGSALTRPSCR